MTMFRNAANRAIDAAHSAVAGADMLALHAYTDVDKAYALDQMAEAQRYLARAIATKTAWDASEHDDYEAYPDVPRQLQDTLL